MEDFTKKNFIQLPAGHKGKLTVLCAYSTYRYSINNLLNKSLSYLNRVDFYAFCMDTELFDPDV